MLGTVGDEQVFDRATERLGSERPHLARADDQSRGVGERSFLVGEPCGGAAERDHALVDGGLGACALADVDGLLDAFLEHRADPADRAGVRVGVLQLAEDLVLAEHERFQSAGNPHEVAEALLVAELADDFVGTVGDDRRKALAAVVGIVGDDVQLRTITRLERERLANALVIEQYLDEIALVAGTGRLDLFDARVLMGDAHAGNDPRGDSHRSFISESTSLITDWAS